MGASAKLSVTMEVSVKCSVILGSSVVLSGRMSATVMCSVTMEPDDIMSAKLDSRPSGATVQNAEEDEEEDMYIVLTMSEVIFREFTVELTIPSVREFPVELTMSSVPAFTMELTMSSAREFTVALTTSSVCEFTIELTMSSPWNWPCLQSVSSPRIISLSDQEVKCKVDWWFFSDYQTFTFSLSVLEFTIQLTMTSVYEFTKYKMQHILSSWLI